MGKVLLAQPRGYCAGVDRAVSVVKKALELYGPPIYVRREIVHNKYVVETLAAQGAVFVRELDEIPPGSRVVFSAHGVAPSVYAQAEAFGLKTIDATCPLVTKVHREARRFADKDFDIVLIGHHGHEEVEGTQGQAPEHIQVIDEQSEIDRISVRDEEKVVWLSQTTLSVDQTMSTVDKLRERFPKIHNPPSDDICFATQNRQGAVKIMAPLCDVVVVVGSANSSNSVRLVEVARCEGAGAAYRIDAVSDLEESWFEQARVVGVTSGASVPEILVSQLLKWLAQRGFDDVQTVQTVDERTTFSLPRDLRAELKSAGME